MRKRETNPFAILLLVLTAVIGLVAAFIVRSLPAVAASSWSGLIFWIVFIIISGGGGFLIGKFFGRGGRR